MEPYDWHYWQGDPPKAGKRILARREDEEPFLIEDTSKLHPSYNIYGVYWRYIDDSEPRTTLL